MAFDWRLVMTIPTESTTYADESLYVTHGAASDVTPHSAVIWSRANREGIMHVTVSKNQNSYGSIHKKVEFMLSMTLRAR